MAAESETARLKTYLRWREEQLAYAILNGTDGEVAILERVCANLRWRLITNPPRPDALCGYTGPLEAHKRPCHSKYCEEAWQTWQRPRLASTTAKS